jgi:pyruvate/2-oxoglutarate dehydrogenase complex dihydrolipoamide dehydrogenase (E3) component
MPGRRVVVLGSGDVGLIMARRFTLEGAHVEGVYEIMPHPGGLSRNVVQCLHDFDIPLHLSHTVVDIRGKRRLTGVTVARVDRHGRPAADTQRDITCDCLVLAVGLIPENEISRDLGLVMDGQTGGPVVDERMGTSVPGVFACGNVVHVHDMVDDVTEAGTTVGTAAAAYTCSERRHETAVPVVAGSNVRYVVPQVVRYAVRENDPVRLYFRVKIEQRNTRVVVSADGREVFQRTERVVRPAEMVSATVEAGRLTGAREVRVDART